MSADLSDDQMNSPLVPDMSALDAALREVLNAAPHPTHEREPSRREETRQEKPLALDETMDVVSRAASTIDELIERNRSITDAAVRSVEFFRTQAGEYRSETERLKEEVRVLREQSEAQRIAALAQTEELEHELATRTAELEMAQAWISEIKSQVEHLLGDAEARLDQTADDSLFRE